MGLRGRENHAEHLNFPVLFDIILPKYKGGNEAMEYQPKGVCSKQIHFDIVDNKVRNVSFLGGCNGNLQGISRLIEGMDVHEAISRIEGIKCGFKKTSCPDQLAHALKEAVGE